MSGLSPLARRNESGIWVDPGDPAFTAETFLPDDTDADLIERVAEWLHDDENATDRWEDRGESTRRAYRSGSRDLLDALREAGYSVTRDRDAAQRDTEERGESR